MRDSAIRSPSRFKLGKILKWVGLAIWGAALVTVVMLLIGACSTPTSGDKTRKVYVVNSLWQVVKTEIVSREILGDDLNEEVEAYNAVTLDDFLRIYYDTLPDLSNAPPVSVFICNPVTYAVNVSYENVPRSELVENEAGWRMQASGQILFIDHVPPPPIVTPPPSLYAWYAIYLVDNSTGAIILEDHCGYLIDESFTGQWITAPSDTMVNGVQGGGWSSVDAYYQTILHAYQMEAVVTANNVHVVTRQLYTPPTP